MTNSSPRYRIRFNRSENVLTAAVADTRVLIESYYHNLARLKARRSGQAFGLRLATDKPDPASRIFRWRLARLLLHAENADGGASDPDRGGETGFGGLLLTGRGARNEQDAKRVGLRRFLQSRLDGPVDLEREARRVEAAVRCSSRRPWPKRAMLPT